MKKSVGLGPKTARRQSWLLDLLFQMSFPKINGTEAMSGLFRGTMILSYFFLLSFSRANGRRRDGQARKIMRLLPGMDETA